MKIYLSLILFFPIVLFAQQGRNPKDVYIKRDIFRIGFITPIFPDYETHVILTGSFEHGFSNSFTFYNQVGIGTYNQWFGTSVERRQSSWHVFGSSELRYYYGIKRRIRKEKVYKNYSGAYLSVQHTLLSNAIAVVDITKEKTIQGYGMTYANLGYQIQNGKVCFGAYFGARLTEGIDYSINGYKARILPYMHGGISIVYVFK